MLISFLKILIMLGVALLFGIFVVTSTDPNARVNYAGTLLNDPPNGLSCETSAIEVGRKGMDTIYQTYPQISDKDVSRWINSINDSCERTGAIEEMNARYRIAQSIEYARLHPLPAISDNRK